MNDYKEALLEDALTVAIKETHKSIILKRITIIESIIILLMVGVIWIGHY